MITGGMGLHGGFFAEGLGSYVKRIIARIMGGRGRRGKKSWLSKETWWYNARDEEAQRSLADEVNAAIARDAKAFEREKQILVENTRMMFAEESIDKQLSEEEKERQSNSEQRGRAFFALEMGKASDIRDVSDEAALRNNAQRRAAFALQAHDTAADRQVDIKKQRLMNLEKANIAREKKAAKAKLAEEKKAARAEEIKKTRLKNLKKARAAKKRKKKKGKK